MSIAVRPLTYNAYHNPVSYEEPGRPLILPRYKHEQPQPPFPALHLFSLNNTFAPKHILLGPPTVSPEQRLKMGRQTSQKTMPHPSNTFFDSKVLSRTHAELWAENGKIYIRDLRSSNGTFINGKRLSPEGCESDAAEIKNEDLLEFGIDIVAEDGQSILHHKVAARAFTILDAHAADRAQHDWTNLYRFATIGAGADGAPAQNGAGAAGATSSPAANGAGASASGGNQQPASQGVGPGGSIMGPGAEGGLRRTKGGKSFDHVIALLQAEMNRLSASGMGGPEAAAARAAAAAKHRERVANARSSRAQDQSQGSDGGPLSPLDETAQRLTLLLSSLSATRSQLDALRAAAAHESFNENGDEEEEEDNGATMRVNPGSLAAVAVPEAVTEEEEEGQGEQKSEDEEEGEGLSTVTPSTPIPEPGEEEALLLQHTQPKEEKPSSPTTPAPVTHVPTTAAAAIERLPALRDSLSTLLSNVYEARSKALAVIRAREARASEEQMAGTEMRGLVSHQMGMQGPRRGGRGTGRGPRGTGTGTGGRLMLSSFEGGAGEFSTGSQSPSSLLSGMALPSPLSPTTPSGSSSLGDKGAAQNGTLGSPPKEPLPSLPPEAAAVGGELDGLAPMRSRSGSTGSAGGKGDSSKRQHRTGQLRMSSVRSGAGGGAGGAGLFESESESESEVGDGDGDGAEKSSALFSDSSSSSSSSSSSLPPPATPSRSSVALPLEDEEDDFGGANSAGKAGAGARRAPPPPPPPSGWKSGGSGGRKRSADEHFEAEDEEAVREADALLGASASAEVGERAGIPEGVSVSVQGSGSAPTSLSALEPLSFGVAGIDSQVGNELVQGGKDEVGVEIMAEPGTITAARLDRLESTLEELRAKLDQVQRARGSVRGAAAAPSRKSTMVGGTPAGVGGGGGAAGTISARGTVSAKDLMARLERLESRASVKGKKEAGGLAGLRERWLGEELGGGGGMMPVLPTKKEVVNVEEGVGAGAGTLSRRTKAEEVWDGLQTKFGTGTLRKGVAGAAAVGLGEGEKGGSTGAGK